MPPGVVADGFVLLSLPPGRNPIPYVYWNIGVTDRGTWEKANREGKLRDLPRTHSAIYAPAIDPALQTGIEALALSALTTPGCGLPVLEKENDIQYEERENKLNITHPFHRFRALYRSLNPL